MDRKLLLFILYLHESFECLPYTLLIFKIIYFKALHIVRSDVFRTLHYNNKIHPNMIIALQNYTRLLSL